MTVRARPHPAVAARRRQVARAHGRRRRGRLGLVAMGLLSFAVGWWIAVGPLLAPRGVSISGYTGRDLPQLEAALERAAGQGSLLSLPRGALRRTAMQFPAVREIGVRRDLPFGVAVDVIPARPLAVAAGAGQPVLVSETGRVLGPAPERAGVGWLRLSGPPPAYGQPLPAASRAALTLLAALPPEMSRRVRGLQRRGGRLEGRLTGGPELRLGPPSDMAVKALALEALLNNLPPEKEKAASYIDLSAPRYPSLGT
jgi:cell division septal protein FtsQ